MSKATEDGKTTATTNVPSDSQNTTPGSEQNVTSRPTAGPSRVVGNQAKKQDEVTRQGTQKMKFVPTLPARRKKPDEVKQEEAPTVPKPTERGRGRGRGLPGGRGRGGPPPPRTEIQMTASGPFAMGPALAGSSSKRRVPRSNFTAVMPTGPGSSTIGEGLSSGGPPTLSRDKDKQKSGQVKQEEEDIEVYSDPDDGVQIVDMDAVKTMDWMAPESLGRERDDGKKSKKKKTEKIKKELKGKGKEQAVVSDVEDADVVEEKVEKNLANALNLSESEEEEEMEDLIDDFAMENADDEDSLTRQEKLYFFQFPQPFPTFTLPGEGEATTGADPMTADGHKPAVIDSKEKTKKAVSFAPDAKLPGPSAEKPNESQAANPAPKRIDGIIGQLEVHRSGMIKMRLNNGVLMDVMAATQPSFLQHAVSLDPTAKKLHVLGEVNRRFVVSPDVDKLLEELDRNDEIVQPNAENEMDTT